jgi:hypothetical protein
MTALKMTKITIVLKILLPIFDLLVFMKNENYEYHTVMISLAKLEDRSNNNNLIDIMCFDIHSLYFHSSLVVVVRHHMLPYFLHDDEYTVEEYQHQCTFGNISTQNLQSCTKSSVHLFILKESDKICPLCYFNVDKGSRFALG